MEWCEANGVDYIFGLAGTTCCSPDPDRRGRSLRAPRRGRTREAPDSDRVPLRRQNLDLVAPRRGSSRGHHLGLRCALYRHDARRRLGRASLRNGLLRAETSAQWFDRKSALNCGFPKTRVPAPRLLVRRHAEIGGELTTSLLFLPRRRRLPWPRRQVQRPSFGLEASVVGAVLDEGGRPIWSET
jgi:hypothetical protein